MTRLRLLGIVVFSAAAGMGAVWISHRLPRALADFLIAFAASGSCTWLITSWFDMRRRKRRVDEWQAMLQQMMERERL